MIPDTVRKRSNSIILTKSPIKNKFIFEIEHIPNNLTRVRGKHIAYLVGVGKVMGSMLGPNHVIDNAFKICTFCCYVRCATLIV